MLNKDEIGKVTYLGLIKEKDPFTRYDVEFKGDYLPDEIADRADMFARKDNIGAHFSTYPNNNVIAHFKFYPEGDGENSLTLTVTGIDKKILFMTDIPLFDEEVNVLSEAAVETVLKDLYETYKQEWVEENVTSAMQEEIEDSYEDYVNSLEDGEEKMSLEDYIEENGYGSGSLYACYDEFLGAEYQDKGWVQEHLNSEQAKVLWENDVDFPFEEIKNVKWNDGKTIFTYDPSQKQTEFTDKE